MAGKSRKIRGDRGLSAKAGLMGTTSMASLKDRGRPETSQALVAGREEDRSQLVMGDPALAQQRMSALAPRP